MLKLPGDNCRGELLMRRYLFPILFLTIIIFTDSAYSKENNSLLSQQDLSRWVTYYYLNPQPKKFIPAVHALSKSGTFDEHGKLSPLVVFFSEVFRQNISELPGWVKEISKLPMSQRQFFWKVLWETNTSESHALLQKQKLDERENEFISEITKKPPIRLVTMEITYPLSLDMLWGGFMAVGNEKYVKRIIDVLDWEISDGQRDKMNRIVIVRRYTQKLCLWG